MKLPKPEQEGAGDYAPWLTPDAFGKVGTKGSVVLLGTMRESNGNFGAGIILDVKVKGRPYAWTIKFKSGNYPRLHKRFGDNDKRWKGNVNIEVKEYLDKPYVAVV